MKRYGYPWPASAIGEDEMRLLHAEREGSEEHRPISKLIRDAVRECYGAQNMKMEGEGNYEDKDAAQAAQTGSGRTRQDRAA